MALNPMLQHFHFGFWQGVNQFGVWRRPVDLLDIQMVSVAEGEKARVEFIARPLGMDDVRLIANVVVIAREDLSPESNAFETGLTGGQAIAEYVVAKVDEQFWKERCSG